ncbi:MAG: NAD(P)-binding domain-containing protein, partial [Ilumatobacteraceae bacterium]
MTAAANVPSLSQRLSSRDATVGVLGLGYVGLPLAISFAEVGYQVVGFDVSDSVVATLNSGSSHIDDVTP